MHPFVFAGLLPVVRVLVPALLVLVAPVVTVAQEATSVPISVQSGGADDAGVLVYHQITAFTDKEQFAGVGYPVLTADGTRAVFADAPGTQDPAVPNRVFVINPDGSGLTEVDAYQTHCYCGSEVDISADGSVVASTESMQLRLVAVGGEARTLVDLNSNEASSIRLTADGDRLFFILGRDTGFMETSTTLERGIYVVEADGSDLRQVAGPDGIAQLLGTTADQVGMLRLQTQALDVSDDGSRLIFGASISGQMAVFAVNDDGSGLHQLTNLGQYVPHVAISGDGATVAYDVVPPETHGDNNEISVDAFEGGAPRLLAETTYSGWSDPMRLTPDGSKLLLSPNSLLFDTASGEVRQLSIITPGADSYTAVVIDGLPRATMNAEATRFLYVKFREQLATLELDPAELGAAPTITDLTVDPDEIPLDYAAAATASAAVAADGELVAVGVVALRNGQYDVNIARGVLHDDGLNGDVTANDGVFTNNFLAHVMSEARDDDTGPRVLRVQAEVVTADGFHHATAVEFGPLTVESA
jgi:hypothetical protein